VATLKPPFPCNPIPQPQIFTDWLRSQSVEVPPLKSLGLDHYKDGDATVVGDIYTPRIAIEDGAFLEGNVWVHKNTPPPRTKKDHSGVAGGVR
jgi:hypothetical protein